jgi:PD-(D/E)XK nuclease superfamily
LLRIQPQITQIAKISFVPPACNWDLPLFCLQTKIPKIGVTGGYILLRIYIMLRVCALMDDDTYQIIGAAFEVHSRLGSGFLEAVYQEALHHEFDERGILFRRQRDLAGREPAV